MKLLFLRSVCLISLLPFIGEASDDFSPTIELKALVLSAESTSQQGSFKGIEIVNLEIPGDAAKLKKTLQTQFISKPISKDLLLQIKKEITHFYEQEGHPLVLFNIHEQDITEGVIQVQVTESKINRITTEGNRYFSSDLIKKYMHTNEREPLHVDTLLADLSFLNQNPFLKTKAVFAPGANESTTDLILVTEDRLPLRFYVGADNTGTKYTEDARMYTGINWGNAFFVGDSLSYQYTTSNDFHKFQSHTFQYQASLPSIRQQLEFFGGLSYMHPSLNQMKNEVEPPADHIRSNAWNGQASGRYKIPFGETWQGKWQGITFGYDYKYSNSNLVYIGDEDIPIVYKTLNLSQFMAGYYAGYTTPKHRLTFDFDFFFAPFQMYANASNNDFNAQRAQAKNQYCYGRLSLLDTYFMPYGLSLFTSLRAQASYKVLVPSEQYGLGGYDTVRGYDERVFLADNALNANIELHLPSFRIFFSKNSKNVDRCYFLLFADAAGGWNYPSLRDEKRNDWLASIGPGFRYQIQRYLQARVDYGFKLHKDSNIGTSLGKFHLALISSY